MATLFDSASLVMIPSGYKDDKLYSIKPTDGSGDFTFSRDGAGASPATRVNASGLIEKGRENLLLQSNQFDTTWFLNGATTITSGQIGYDGSNDAWLLTNTGNQYESVRQNVSNSGVDTFSVYAKAGTLNYVVLDIDPNALGVFQWFDLSGNGSVGTDLYGNVISAKIESVGGGWFRCSVTGNVSTAQVRIYPVSADGVFTTTAGNIYIQDAQLEQGLVATDYIETTTAPVSAGLLGDMPRLDYSGGATCPSLLLEPSRVNSLTHSEYFGSASWGASNITITSNATTSPEGIENATTIENTSGSNYLVYTASVSASTTYQFSFYAKNIDATNVDVLFYDASNASVISTIAYEGDLTTEWKRLDFSVSTPVGCTSLGVNIAYGLSGSMHIYGAQLEAGSYPTSYIPTYGSASVRAVDGSGASDGTSSPFTLDADFGLYWEGIINGTLVYPTFFSGGDYSLGGDYRSYLVYNGNTFQLFGINEILTAQRTIALSIGTYYKILVKRVGSTIKWYVNGTEYENSVGTTTTDVKIRSLFGANIGAPNHESVSKVMIFPTALTDAEAIALTTI